MKPLLGKIAYGMLFTVGLPALLVWWAGASLTNVALPPVRMPWLGWTGVGAGMALMLSGIGSLAIYGKGLPMNPFPPGTLVSRGVYRATPHPIYLGFGLTCFGIAILGESSSGLWLVTPVVILALVALVLGFEAANLRARLGVGPAPRLSLPAATGAPPTGWNRLAVYLLVFLPWSLGFEAISRLGIPRDAVVAYLPFERGWPVVQWTEAVYAATYLVVLATPFVIRTSAALRRFAVLGILATAVVIPIYLVVPLIAPPKPFQAESFLGRMLLLERSLSHTVAAFPSFHVLWSLIAADAWTTRSRGWGRAGYAIAVLIAASCITTGMHALADLAAGGLMFLLLRDYRKVWRVVRQGTERIANSWREWRWGGVRIMSYGIYPALAGAIGFWISASLGGAETFWTMVGIYLAALLGAGLMAQQLEGSPKLSRPFGYYGAVLGGVVIAVLGGVLSGHTVRLLALMAVAGPWVQAIGRLRCLVQGCCHGAPAHPEVGIRYFHERSRAVGLANLRGIPLHPTPLYSLVGNVTIGVLLLRLWSLGASYGIIAGLYLILAGVARFLEEGCRGEPQTAVIGGLRVYQWFAIASVMAGIYLTTVPSGGPGGLVTYLNPLHWPAGALFGLCAGAAMGIDFPRSSGRFARLAAP